MGSLGMEGVWGVEKEQLHVIRVAAMSEQNPFHNTEYDVPCLCEPSLHKKLLHMQCAFLGAAGRQKQRFDR